MDMTFDEGQMKIGRRLAIKLLNASKFALGVGQPAHGAAVTEPVDQSMLVRLAALVEEATGAFDRYDYARALERTEAHFWSFCDDYLELVKNRAYSEEPTAELHLALEVLLKLFAPFLPYVTEEVWSWWREGSIHRSDWPDATELREAAADGDPLVLAVAADVLTEVRRAKSEAKRSMRAPVEKVKVTDTPERLGALDKVALDLRSAGAVDQLFFAKGEAFSVEVTLAPEPPKG
jgi:valyl-tRNA synthetase